MSSTNPGPYTRPGEPLRPATGLVGPDGTYHVPVHHRISWGAILSGAAVAIASTLMLSLLGSALGLGAANPLHAGVGDARGTGQGAGIWQVLSWLFSLGLGGYVAARHSGTRSHMDGELHGLSSWAIAALLGSWLLSQLMGGLFGHSWTARDAQVVAPAATTVNRLVDATTVNRLADAGTGMVGSGVVGGTVAAGDAMVDRLRRSLSVGGDPASMTRDQIQSEIALVIGNGLSNGLNDADRNRLIALVAAEAGITRDEATRRVARLEADAKTRVAQVEANARAADEARTHRTSVASRALFASLSLGLLGSLLGAWLGTRHNRAIFPAVAHHVEPAVHYDTHRTVYETTTHPVGQRPVYPTTETVRTTTTPYGEDARNLRG